MVFSNDKYLFKISTDEFNLIRKLGMYEDDIWK
jgi:hypothetical protein